MPQERVASLHRMLAMWDGWTSVAMLVDDYADAVRLGPDLLVHQGRKPPLEQRIALSVVEVFCLFCVGFQLTLMISSTIRVRQDRGYRAPLNRFPYNVLRNVALSRCNVDYVMAVDVDFVPFPAPSPSELLRHHLSQLDVRAGSPNVLVLAAFEQVETSSSALVGLDKPHLRELVLSGDIIGFASAVYDAGHRCDHVDRFFSATSAYSVQYEFGCEPYTLLPRAMAHAYEERFVGYGKDRVSWNYELAARGAQFLVPPDAFLVHFKTFDHASARKRQYGHFPTDWMLGESCWAEFRDRVQNEHNYTLYTCHQRSIDALLRGKYEKCIVEVERLCVAPFCSPAVSTFRYHDGQLRQQSAAATSFVVPTPPPPGPPVALEYRTAELVLLGCESCGIPELWRTLLLTKEFVAAAVDPGEPAWRDRQVHFFDREGRYLLGQQWYSQRWALPVGIRKLGIDGSASYLQSPEAAMRLAAQLHQSTMLLVVLRDPMIRALRRWKELARRFEYTRSVSFEAKILAEATALLRCFEAKSTAVHSMTLRASVWERCVASVCGFRACITGEGLYASQLAAWQHTARAFRWLLLPEDILRMRPIDGLEHIFASLKLPLPTDVSCIASQLSGWLSSRNESAIGRSSSTIPPESSQRFLRAFFGRYNAPLRERIQQLDPTSTPLWREVSWLPSVEQARSLSGATGLRELQQAASELREILHARRDPVPESLVVGSARWFGSGLRPSVFVLGARDAGSDAIGEYLLAQAGVCGGNIRIFDDDTRYVSGLPATVTRFTRRPATSGGRRAPAGHGSLMSVNSNASGNGNITWISRNSRQTFTTRRTLASACSLLVDTSTYLHSRWAPLRIHSVLQADDNARLRFIVVLRDPVERAVRHWRSLQANAARPPNRHLLKRSTGDVVTPRISDLHGYLNGTSFVKKVRQEVTQIQECLNSLQPNSVKVRGITDISHAHWEMCMTLACNWLECVVGTGLYAPQLLRWWEYFRRDQFLVLNHNELLSEPQHVAERVHAFLDMASPVVEPLPRGESYNSTAVVGDQLRRFMQRFYSVHNKQLKALLSQLASPNGWKQADWLR